MPKIFRIKLSYFQTPAYLLTYLFFFSFFFKMIIFFTYYAGFVGDGLLTAAIVGSACEPPAARAILSAIRILAKQNESKRTN